MKSIFISHSWNDKPFVRKLAKRLDQEGVKVWIDEAQINIGDSLIQKISEGIEYADYVAAVISAKSVKSEWVRKELHLAMTKEIKGKKIVVLPLLVEHCDLPDFLKDKLYADFTNTKNFAREFLKLLRVIGIDKTKADRPQKQHRSQSTRTYKNQFSIPSAAQQNKESFLDRPIELQIRPSKNLESSSYYTPVFDTDIGLVDRENEVIAIQDVLYRLITPGRLVTKPILEFNGIGGIGKTALLNKVWQIAKSKNNLHSAFINFEKFLKDKSIDRNAIIRDIVIQLDIKNDLFAQIYAPTGDNSIEQDLTPKFIEYFKLILQSPQQETPVALFFDSVDRVDKSVKNWLISLLEHTVDTGKILFAFASKTSLGFSEKPGLDKKIYSFRLKEFNEEFTSRYINSLNHCDKAEDLQNWTQAVFQITQGHPFANEVVISEAQKKNYQPQDIKNKQYELIQIINQWVVIEKIFQGYETKEIDRFRKILAPLSIPRMFNLVSIGKLFEEFTPEYALRSSWHYSNYIRELLTETSFIRYSREKSAYIVDPILRSVFSLTMKHEDLKKFFAMHEFLINLYTDWIKDARGTDKTKFFLEKIYHQLCIQNPVSTFIPEFEKFAHGLVRNLTERSDRDDVKRLFVEEFNGDPDLGGFFDAADKQKIQAMFQTTDR